MAERLGDIRLGGPVRLHHVGSPLFDKRELVRAGVLLGMWCVGTPRLL